jgi:hypothetical protein
MIRKTIFISCGQYTAAEKQLGKQISEMVRDLTDCDPFFAEDVHDLNGLDANILSALHIDNSLRAILLQKRHTFTRI